MRHFAFFYIILVFGSFLMPTVNGQDKLYVTEERVNFTCHYDRNDTNKKNGNMSQEIDKLLDKLYSLIKTDAKFEESCNHSVSFDFEHLTRNGSQLETATTEVKANLNELLEGFELQKAKYDQGLWGYCAQEGGKELLRNISAVIATAKKQQITICNRDELLACHSKFSKCQCIVDTKNFRSVASEFWDDAEEGMKAGISIEKSACVLLPGSYCPIGESASYECHPTSKCLFKVNRSACNPLHEQIKVIDRTLLVDVTSSMPPTRLRREIDDSRNSSTETHDRMNSSTETHDGRNSSKEVGGGNIGTTNDTTKYRFIRTDYPSVHCQCYAYFARESSSAAIAIIVGRVA